MEGAEPDQQLGSPPTPKREPITAQLARLRLQAFTNEVEDELIQNKPGFQRLKLSSLSAAAVVDAPLERHCSAAVDRLSQPVVSAVKDEARARPRD